MTDFDPGPSSIRDRDIDPKSVNTEELNNTVANVADADGATLAQKLENSIQANPDLTQWIPADNEGSAWGWDKAVTITTDEVEVVGPFVKIESTVASGNGALLTLDGNRCIVEGLHFASESGTPDVAIEATENEARIRRCMVGNGPVVGIRVETQAFKSRVEECRVGSVDGDAFQVDSVSNVYLKSCYTASPGGRGYELNGANSVVVVGCAADTTVEEALFIDNAKGYEVNGFHTESARSGGASGDSIVVVDGTGTSGSFSGGRIIPDPNDTRRAFHFKGGAHTVEGVDAVDVSDYMQLTAKSGTGQLGQAFPQVDITGIPLTELSWTDNSADLREVRHGGDSVSQTDLTDSDHSTGAHVGQTRFHDGTNGSNTNTAGPAVWNGSNWISLIDGGTIV